MRIALSREDLTNMFANAFDVDEVTAESDEDGQFERVVIKVRTSLNEEDLPEMKEYY